MPTNSERTANTPTARTLTATLILLAGLYLLWLAVPRVIVSFTLLPGDPVLKTLHDGKPVASEGLERLVNSRRKALRWLQSGQMYSELSLGLFHQAKTAGLTSEPGRRLLSESRTELERGLALAPANTYGWSRLAYILFVQNEEKVRAAEALKMSWKTGPMEERLLFSRLDIGLRAWMALGDDGRALAKRQLRHAWRTNKKKLIALARQRKSIKRVMGVLDLSAQDLKLKPSVKTGGKPPAK